MKERVKLNVIFYFKFFCFIDSNIEPSTELNWRSDNNGEQISLIASQTVTKNIELLQILEAR